uniref:Uncharacterized protein n=1 Tax=Cacopsylla melanoneura TaxID=428564 RepID=A0A8D8U3B2_9HEMI
MHNVLVHTKTNPSQSPVKKIKKKRYKLDSMNTGDFMKKWTVEFMEFQSFLTHSSTLVLNFHRNKTAAPYRNKSGVWNVFHIIFPSTGWSVVMHLLSLDFSRNQLEFSKKEIDF